jgi:peptide/nickel transport system substrate-binding protein
VAGLVWGREGSKVVRAFAEKFRLVFFFSVLFQFGWTVQGCPDVRAATIIKIGMLEEPKTLNIWLASDGWSRKVLGQIYQPLYIREPDSLKMIPWLAKDQPVYDEASLSYTVKLKAAKWSDGSEFTAEDVAFTGESIKAFKIPRYHSNWRFIKKTEAMDKRTVRFFLERPEAIFLTRTLTTPIVQKKEWAKILLKAKRSKRPLAELHKLEVKRPVGTGPFMLKEWKRGSYLFLSRNKHFFGRGKNIQGYLLGPYVDGMVLKIYGTTDAAVLALRKGSLDMFWWGIQPGYLEDLRQDSNIKIFSAEKSSLYYLGFNLRKRPFNDVNFRRAVATLINKDFIVKRILQGHAIKMPSIVPPGNSFWHRPDLLRYGEGLSRKDRIRKAYKILREAGYAWEEPPVDAHGRVVGGEEIIMPDGEPMEDVSILTPPADYDPHRAMAGIMIQEWLRAVGIPASSKPMAFGALYHQVSIRHEFDLFVLGYGQLSLDPDYLRNFFHSSQDRARGWNMSGYRNPEFDRVAEESSRTMDPEKRRELIWKMQGIIMSDVPYIPLYNPKHIEAVRTDNFGGWVQMLGGIGNTWSFCLLKPK